MRIAHRNRGGTAVSAAAPLSQAAVEDSMHRGIVTCSVDATVAEVAATMARERIHCVVVAGVMRREGGERLTWGVLSDLDLMAAIASGDTDARAGSLAATGAVTVATTDPLADAARIMAEHQVAHLVVVDADSDRPVGVLSTLDVALAAS
jgi:CBS domain-containing protein